jgi:hypothetical protein
LIVITARNLFGGLPFQNILNKSMSECNRENLMKKKLTNVIVEFKYNLPAKINTKLPALLSRLH